MQILKLMKYQHVEESKFAIRLLQNIGCTSEVKLPNGTCAQHMAQAGMCV